MEAISSTLSITDPDSWNLRLDAIHQIEQMIAGGTLSLHQPMGNTFVNYFRNMPFQDQLEDLRSQITRLACQVAAALAFELQSDFAPLAELWLPSVLKLCISGVRLMAMQGVKCMHMISAFGGTGGYPRVIPMLCDGCIEKANHPNHKRGCVIALTVALRVWTGASTAMERMMTLILKAIESSAGDRDPAVREDGRKFFWALYARFPNVAEDLLVGMDATNQKRLHKCKDATNAEWEEGGIMQLVTLGNDPDAVVKAAKKKGSVKPRMGKKPLPQGGNRRPASVDTSQNQKLSLQERRKAAQQYGRAKAPSGPSPRNSTASPSPSPKNASSDDVNHHSQTQTQRPKPARISIKEMRSKMKREALAKGDATPGTQTFMIASLPRDDKPPSPVSSPGALPLKITGIALNTQPPPPPTPKTIPLTLDAFLELAHSPGVSTKQETFNSIYSSLSTEPQPFNSPPPRPIDVPSFTQSSSFILEKFAMVLSQHISHANNDVSNSALQACQACLSHKKMSIVLTEQYLPLLLVPILNEQAKLQQKHTVSSAGMSKHGRIIQDCLDSLCCSVGPIQMMEVISSVMAKTAKTIDHNDNSMSEGAKLCLVKVLITISTPQVQVFLVKNENLKMLLQNIAKLMRTSVNNTSVKQQHDEKVSMTKWTKSVERVLRALFRAVNNEDMFTSTFLEIPQDDFLALRNVLEDSTEEWTVVFKGCIAKVCNARSPSKSIDKPEEEEEEEIMLASPLPNKKRAAPKPLSPRDLEVRYHNSVINQNEEEVVQRQQQQLQQSNQEMNSPTTETKISSPKHKTIKSAHLEEENTVIAANTIATNTKNNKRTPLAAVNRPDVHSPPSNHYPQGKQQPKTPITNPVLRYMSQASPLLTLKSLSNDPMEELPLLLEKLSVHPDNCGGPSTSCINSDEKNKPEELYLIMQSLLQLARENSTTPPLVWDKHFDNTIHCLLQGIKPSVEVNSSSHKDDSSSSIQELYLHGLRALIKYQPNRLSPVLLETIMGELLQRSLDSTYETIHTAERGLEMLVSTQNPALCLQILTPFLNRATEKNNDNENNKNSSSSNNTTATIVLSSLRTLVKLIKRVPKDILQENLQKVLLPVILKCIKDTLVDMRKASVFCIVEIYFVVGDSVLMPHLNQTLNAAQLKLIGVYIARHEKSNNSNNNKMVDGGMLDSALVSSQR